MCVFAVRAFVLLLLLPCRDIMADLATFLVRPLVVMLRDAQDASGPGYTLQDVLHGMSNNRQVRPAAAFAGFFFLPDA